MAERGRPRAFDRAAALHRAMHVFWEKGYDGASLAELTAAMGINSPSLYAAFGCKQQLFREALELYGATEGGGVWDALDEAATAREAIEGMLRASTRAFTRPGRPHGCLIALGALHADAENTAVCRELQRHRANNAGLLRRRLDRAVAEGELAKGVDTRAVAVFYATLQHGMSIQARDGASRKTLMAVADSAMAGWESLIGPRRHPKGPPSSPQLRADRRCS
jgi:AcrR family transcriptional regulator